MICLQNAASSYGSSQEELHMLINYNFYLLTSTF